MSASAQAGEENLSKQMSRVPQIRLQARNLRLPARTASTSSTMRSLALLEVSPLGSGHH